MEEPWPGLSEDETPRTGRWSSRLGTIPRAVGGAGPVSPRSRSETPTRTVPARRTAADPAWTGAERRGAARARGRRADHDPAIWIDAHGLGLHAGGVLH